MTLGSLFAGLGGFDLAAQAVGIETRWFCEVNPFCRSLLAERFPGLPCYGDIREVDWTEAPKVDVVCAGWPCPPVSCAGKRKGVEDERWLWPEVVRVLREVAPRWFVGENVAGLLSANAGAAFGDVLRDLARLGYDAEWRVLRASDVGAPHRRARVFVVAHRYGGGRDPAGVPDKQGRDLPYPCGKIAPMAHCPKRGFPVVREPSGSGGFVDGSNEELGNTNRVHDLVQGSVGCEIQREGPETEGFSKAMAHSHLPGLEGSSDRLAGRMGCSDERHARPDGLPTFPPGPEEYDEWKRVLAVRPDLDPACPGADGKRGLNPLFVEWLMGFPLGWTAIPGATRAKRLSALGNAMVPKVAEVAFQRVTECAECADPTCGGRS